MSRNKRRETRAEQREREEWEAYQDQQTPKFKAIRQAIDDLFRAELMRPGIRDAIDENTRTDAWIESQLRHIRDQIGRWIRATVDHNLCDLLKRIDELEGDLKKAQSKKIAPTHKQIAAKTERDR